jgi:glycosyltransferase involved in cell wall biosynthesis
MTKVSIIMPVYNGEKFLKKSIRSVSKQTLKDIELICVDDGSTDNSLQVLQELQEKYDFIKILTQENQGSGKARNYGIDEASGEYIGFLDADDIFVDKTALKKMYELGRMHEADMVAGNLEELLPDGDLIYNSNYTDKNYYEFKKMEKIHPREYGVPWAFYKNIFKKSFLDEKDIRFRDLIRGQDPVFLAEVLVNVDEIYGLPVVLYAYLFPVQGKPYIKVNSPKKKLHYITHYKRTFDIFEENGLRSLSEKYKPKFMNYLRYTARVGDLEAYEIVMDVFGRDNNYFENFQNRYDFFRVSHLLNKINVINTEEYFFEAKEKLSQFKVWENKHITAYQHRLISFINSCETFEEYKVGYPEIHLVYLRDENRRLTKKRKELKRKVKSNKKKNRKLKKSYKSLLKSSSWRATSFLRRN